MPDWPRPIPNRSGAPAPGAGLPPPTRLQLRNLPRRPASSTASPPAGGLVSLAYADVSPEVLRRVEERINGRTAFPARYSAAAANATEQVRLTELERELRQREQEADDRERALEELQARLMEREREIAELENLQRAREHVLLAQRRSPASAPAAASEEEKAAMEKLRAELDAREISLREARAAIKERERFVEQSESTLLDKVAAQQEQEIALEQREENLRGAEDDFRRRLAKADPAVAAELEAERLRPRDEFKE